MKAPPHGIFPKACLALQNGTITLDQLPFVLVGAEVQASAKEIEEAIEQLLPNADQADTLFEFRTGGLCGITRNP